MKKYINLILFINLILSVKGAWNDEINDGYDDDGYDDYDD
jgi:hypothetical protein